MKPIQSYLSLLMSFLLICASSELVGCGGKDATTPAPALQQASAAQAPPANGDQTPPANPDQAQQVQLPQVNLSADGLDELLMPIALYPDPVLAVILQATANPQEVMDGVIGWRWIRIRA